VTTLYKDNVTEISAQRVKKTWKNTCIAAEIV